jgi:hypothetical protein
MTKSDDIITNHGHLIGSLRIFPSYHGDDDKLYQSKKLLRHGISHEPASLLKMSKAVFGIETRLESHLPFLREIRT